MCREDVTGEERRGRECIQPMAVAVWRARGVCMAMWYARAGKGGL